jgi:predicted ATPase/DNA-binding SARP family transcriptional activator
MGRCTAVGERLQWRVHVKLFGAPAVGQGDDRLVLSVGKRSALLYYLACRGTWVTRDELVFLLWPDRREEKARQNLRQLLGSVRKLLHPQALETETNRLRWHVSTDVHEFRRALGARQVGRAVQLYSGELLHGVTLPEAPEFERWLELERLELHRDWREAVLVRARELGTSGRRSEAAEVLARLSKADPLDEEVLRHYLQALHAGHHRSKALEVFAAFQRNLAEELGGEPERVTLELLERLRREEPPVSFGSSAPPPEESLEPRAGHDLPVRTTPFVGRVAEKEKLARLFGDPFCRLITIVGPGGIGKTSLAIAAVEEQRDRFRDGVHFVPLVSVPTPERIVFATADAMGFLFSGQREPEDQLLDFLEDKETLLVLDNFEHLLSGVDYISDALAHAPNIKILATSRERLNLQAEQVFELHGLSLPDAGDRGAFEHDAVKLFAQRAGKVRSDFTLDTFTMPAVVRVCRAVQGMPLAIELAVSWLHALPLEDIASEVERSMDLLEASVRDVPARHRSIRAMFDASWELLAEEERGVLRKLSVFQGGFRRDAAAEVVGASLPMLANLVSKAFLTLTPMGRYRRHPLVLQYIRKKLEEHPEERAVLQERHGLHYLRFVRERQKEFGNEHTFKAAEEELPNITAAWNWALKHGQVDEIEHEALALCSLFRDRVTEGEQFFALAAAALDEADVSHRIALGYVLIAHSGCLMTLVRHEEAASRARRGLELLKPAAEAKGVLAGLFSAGLTTWLMGDFVQARAFLREGLMLSREHPELDYTMAFIFSVALVEREFGSFPQVKQFFQESLAETESSGDNEYVALLKHEYGVYLAQHGLLDEGEELVREGLRLACSIGAPETECLILDNLARVACWSGRYDEAEAISLEVLGRADALSLRESTARAWERLSRVALGRGQDAEAQRCIKKSLTVAWESAHRFSTLEALIRWSELLIARDEVVRAAEWLGLVRLQRGFLNDHNLEVERLLNVLREELSEEELEGALERGRESRLEGVVPRLLSAL